MQSVRFLSGVEVEMSLVADAVLHSVKSITGECHACSSPASLIVAAC